MIDWLVVYLVHSSILLGAVWVVDRRLKQPAWRELAWKTAFLAALLSSSAQHFAPVSPLLDLRHVTGSTEATETTPGTTVSRKQSTRATEPDGRTPASKTVPEHDQTPRDNSATATAPSNRAEIDWPELLITAWLLIAALRLVRVLLGVRSTSQMVRKAQPITDFSTREADVRQSPDVQTPMAVGFRTILIPAGFEALNPAEQQAALYHERAHLQRADPIWRLAFRVVWAVLFIQPLNAMAIRRSEEAAEFLCDAHAVHRSRVSPRSLANTLAYFARITTPDHNAPALACAMAEKPVIQRIQHLMENTMPSPQKRFPITVSAIGLAVLAVIVLPGFARESTTTGTVVEVTDKKFGSRMSLHHQEDGLEIRVKSKGEVRFRDDETGIASLSDGGYFDLRTDDGDTEYRLLLEADDGELATRFWRDGDEQPFDSDAQQWLTSIMPELFRQTGWDADKRTGRLIVRGGADAVIEEIGLIASDLVARLYVVALVDQAELTSDEMEDLLSQIDAQIQSDLEHRMALSAIFDNQDLSAQNWTSVLRGVEQIQSDLEARMVLTTAAERMPESANLSAYAEALRHIQSDLEARMAIEAIADRLAGRPGLIAELARASADIQSDLEARLALASLVPYVDDNTAFSALLEASREIQSDLESRLLLEELTEAANGPNQLAQVATVAGEIIASDLELRILLSSVLDKSDRDSMVRAAVKKASDKISSTTEKNILLSQLLN